MWLGNSFIVSDYFEHYQTDVRELLITSTVLICGGSNGADELERGRG